MTDALRLELRFAAFMAALVGLYFLIVAAFAAEFGQSGMFDISSFNPMVLAVWGITLGFLVIAFCLDTAIRQPRNFLPTIAVSLRKHVLRSDALLARATIFLAWFFMMYAFSPFKAMIGRVRGFPFDASIAHLDRTIFFGHDAWQITHAIFGAPVPTMFLQVCYNAWFVMMWLSVIYCIVRSDDVVLRTRFSVAFVLCWMLIGSLAAYFLASAGPCFYQRAFGDAHFAPLMAHLANLNGQIAAELPNMKLASLDMQSWLWQAYADNTNPFGAGISAMPSVHVGVATLLALGSYEVNKRSGQIMTIYALLIWIASIHLGWHYAADGIIAGMMTVLIWRLSGLLTHKVILSEGQMLGEAEAGLSPAYSGEALPD